MRILLLAAIFCTVGIGQNNLSEDQMEEYAHRYAARKMVKVRPSFYTEGYKANGPVSMAPAYKKMVWESMWAGNEEGLIEYARSLPREYESGVNQGQVTWARGYDRHYEEELARLKAGGAPRIGHVSVNNAPPTRNAPSTPSAPVPSSKAKPKKILAPTPDRRVQKPRETEIPNALTPVPKGVPGNTVDDLK